MKEPALEITESRGPIPVEGACTSCWNVKFKVRVPDNLDRTEALKFPTTQFERHFKVVHMDEDASQAAARIVREATEQK
jgi:hypothetical protein